MRARLVSAQSAARVATVSKWGWVPPAGGTS